MDQVKIIEEAGRALKEEFMPAVQATGLELTNVKGGESCTIFAGGANPDAGEIEAVLDRQGFAYERTGGIFMLSSQGQALKALERGMGVIKIANPQRAPGPWH